MTTRKCCQEGSSAFITIAVKSDLIDGPQDFRVGINKQEATRSMSRPESKRPRQRCLNFSRLLEIATLLGPFLGRPEEQRGLQSSTGLRELAQKQQALAPKSCLALPIWRAQGTAWLHLLWWLLHVLPRLQSSSCRTHLLADGSSKAEPTSYRLFHPWVLVIWYLPGPGIQRVQSKHHQGEPNVSDKYYKELLVV